MIEIKIANETDTDVLALLGTITYVESHGHFIDDKNELAEYLNTAFSIAKTKEDINNPENIFYIIYANKLPVGYAKLVLKSVHKRVASKSNCQLERIYILKHFIPLKIGQQLLTFLEDKAKELQLDTMWLSVYTENKRAIRFYEKNNYKEVGKSIFRVNTTTYENLVFSKRI